MRVNEIFASINGEGIQAGIPCVFIRLAGCNLRCTYCDTAYAQEDSMGMFRSIEDIVAEVKHFGLKHVTLTGGEPLIAEGVGLLINSLVDVGFIVNVETNGSVDLADMPDHKNITYTVDYKCKSSGMSDAMCLTRGGLTIPKKARVVYKFVVGDSDDLGEAGTVIDVCCEQHTCFLSPVFGKIEPVTIVEWLMEHRFTADVRVQVQLHKVIWEPNKRGV